MKSRLPVTFVRYWGSHFKSRWQAGVLTAEFIPLAARHWQCSLVLERPPEDLTWLQELNQMGVVLFYIPRPRGNFDFRCVRRVAALVRQTGSMLFHCDNMHTSPLIGAALGGAKVRIWSKLAMNPEFEECRPATLKERVAISTRLSCWLCTRVIAVSSAVRNELMERGIPEEKIIVRNTPRVPGPAVQTETAPALRDAWGCSPDEVVILAVGRTVPVKGWDVLLQAFAAVVKTAPQARLILAGSFVSPAEKPFHTLLLCILKKHQIQDKVLFTGYLTDVKSALRAADIFVMPSLSEGASFALIQGLDAGLPCVATDVGNAREVIRDGENGYIVPRRDPAALTRALTQLVQDRDLRRRFAGNARVPDHIPDMHESAEQTARDYESLLRGNPVPVFADRRLLSVVRPAEEYSPGFIAASGKPQNAKQ
ncbi:MAG: glycosyltransferase family 4 protein [Limisphaerales bacterium]